MEPGFTHRPVPMSDEEFRLLRDLIYEYCGIHLPESVKFLMERRLRPRLGVFALPTYRDYYRLIRYGRDGAAELAEVIDRITTNETYFFRGEPQLEALRTEILPSIMQEKGPGSTLRIWSAGCSSGEEPYTVAMLLQDLPDARRHEVEIFGNDISRKVLRVAREGLYRQASFRQTPPEMLERHFVPEGNGYRLRAEIKDMVRFGHLNLMDRDAMLGIRDVDVVMCRNVMIYFAPASRRRLLEHLYDRMRPGGVLILGATESLINVSTGFQIEPLENDIVYRKPREL